MNRIDLTAKLPDEAMEAFQGQRLDNSSFDLLVRDDCDVFKPNGELLFKFRKKILDLRLVRKAQHSLRDAAKPTRNRGMAAGFTDESKRGDRENIYTGKGYRYRPILKSGELSKSSYADLVTSGVVGFLDRTVRFPYCRLTEFGHDHAKELSMALGLFQECDLLFRELLPDRWGAQMDAVNQTESAFVLPGTAFTTVTVNKNFQTAVHQDKGDLREGFGVMTVLEKGSYRGGHFVYPQFRIGVDVRHGDLLLSDVHEFHGNTAMVPLTSNWERLSLVLYFRSKMRLCKSAEEELARAKARKKGDPLDRDPERETSPYQSSLPDQREGDLVDTGRLRSSASN